MPFTGSVVDCRRQLPGSPAAARSYGKPSATWGDAELWDWSDVGRSEVGMTADLVLVSAGSAADLSDKRRVQTTIARGTVYHSGQTDATPGRLSLPC